MEQQIRFCTSADGTRIAYATLGAGPPLVHLSSWGGALDDFEHPEVRAYLEGLARGRLLVSFDRRGVGASQREVDDLSLETHVLDLVAVVEHLGLERFDIVGVQESCGIGVAYAARHPERVSRLVLHAPYSSLPDRGRRDAVQELAALMRTNWSMARRLMASTVFPSGPIEAQRGYSQRLRQSTSPEMAARYLEYEVSLVIYDLLPQIKAPTLVLHRRRERVIPFSAAQAIAAAIPNARFVVLDGDIAHYAFDSAEIVRLTNEFLDEGQSAAAAVTATGSSSLVTILFTDMEGSTTLTQRLGDAKAQDLLRAHNAVIREALAAHNGSEIKHTGDGIMASFPSASGALECAITIQKAFEKHNRVGAPLGDGGGVVGAAPGAGAGGERRDTPEPIRVRIGLNAGEPVAEDHPDGHGDLFGTAVQLAARVCAQAEPGQILAANVVRELAAGKGFLFSDQGDIALRGFEDPVRLYEVRWRDPPSPAHGRGAGGEG
jgi:class 3 adenylate cyclase/pimeloyl-ACP methyl ester carboxylesterase